jgi:hypothetical protein
LEADKKKASASCAKADPIIGIIRTYSEFLYSGMLKMKDISGVYV